jgi:hypothetical protein
MVNVDGHFDHLLAVDERWQYREAGRSGSQLESTCPEADTVGEQDTTFEGNEKAYFARDRAQRYLDTGASKPLYMLHTGHRQIVLGSVRVNFFQQLNE